MQIVARAYSMPSRTMFLRDGPRVENSSLGEMDRYPDGPSERMARLRTQFLVVLIKCNYGILVSPK